MIWLVTIKLLIEIQDMQGLNLQNIYLHILMGYTNQVTKVTKSITIFLNFNGFHVEHVYYQLLLKRELEGSIYSQ